jgi:hypothetical protein
VKIEQKAHPVHSHTAALFLHSAAVAHLFFVKNWSHRSSGLLVMFLSNVMRNQRCTVKTFKKFICEFFEFFTKSV